MKNLKIALGLFTQFIKIGIFTFGGGWSIVAQMQKVFSEEAKLITSEELLDIVSIGRSLPGLMTGNIAVLFGYHVAGVCGALACVFGMAIPPFAILSVVTYFYAMVSTLPLVSAAMYGARAAVVPIIVCAALRLMRKAYRYPVCIAVTVSIGILYVLFDVSCIWLVVLGALTGLLICKCHQKEESS